MECIIKDYQPKLHQYFKLLDDAISSREQSIKRMKKSVDDTVSTIDKIYGDLQQHSNLSDTSNFIVLRDGLCKITKEKQQVSDAARIKKHALNSQSRALTSRLDKAKLEIAEIMDECRQVEEQKRRNSLPLVLKLMRTRC